MTFSDRLSNYAQNTQRIYQSWVERLNVKTLNDLEDALEGLSNHQRNQALSALQLYFDTDLSQYRKPIKREHPQDLLSPAEVLELAESLELKYHLMVLLVYSYGLTSVQVVSIKKDDVIMAGRNRGFIKVRQKRYALIPMLLPLMEQQQMRVPPISPWLFPGDNPKRHITTKSLRVALSMQGVTPQKLRQSLAGWYGQPYRSVKQAVEMITAEGVSPL